jgi:hypothetical protein
MLPPLYARWVDEFLGEQPPPETVATCSNCAMCPPAAAQRPGVRYFRPNVKCCTYVPDVPNYLAGGILADPDPAMAKGRTSLSSRMAGRTGVMPLGVFNPPMARYRYQLTAEAGFGQDVELLCPHYVADGGGTCSIWRHRTSVCATWFCKHVRGDVGASFWRLLRDLLLEIERDLALWCLVELGLPPEAAAMEIPRRNPIHARDAGARRDASDPAQYEKLWGAWAGKEADFYIRCAHLVERLSWPDVVSACGPTVRLIERSVKEGQARLLSTSIPDALCAKPFQIIGFDGDRVRLRGYSGSDTVEIPLKLLHVLHYFDGRPTQEALAAIQATQKLRVHEGLVRRLVDYGFLGAA